MLKCLECIIHVLPILCQICCSTVFPGIDILWHKYFNIQIMYSIWLLIHIQAIESTTKNVKYVVKVVDVPDEEESTPHVPTVKLNIASLTNYNNFIFQSDGIRVWRHFNIGKGIVLEIQAK